MILLWDGGGGFAAACNEQEQSCYCDSRQEQAIAGFESEGGREICTHEGNCRDEQRVWKLCSDVVHQGAGRGSRG